MSMSHRPRLTRVQLQEFKSDIKLMNRLIKSELNNGGVAIPVTASQNAYARKLSFDSFAEMSSKCVTVEHYPDFCLSSAFSELDLLDVYKLIKGTKYNGESVTLGHVSNALVEFNTRKSAPSEPTMSLVALHDFLNESELNEHEYTAECGFPNEFEVYATDDFFDSLAHGDQFLVKGGDDHCYYTLFEFKNMYTNLKMYKVVAGKWWNIDESPFCSGRK